jgi:hypothetical protein
MKTNTIDISRLNELLSYDADTGLFTWNKSMRGPVKCGDVAGVNRGDGYIKIKINQVAHYAHRLAWAAFYQEQPPTLLDHVNGDPSDNRIANLRKADPSQNQWNRKARRNNLAGGLKGVRVNVKTGQITASGARLGEVSYLGTHKTVEEAASAYDLWARVNHGEYARLNYGKD